ncbi:hypothetical protein, partial [Blastomonas sp.]|uniref:hypothetical protein n=1 Tax=Blastomonas sp. TaxID=1909299 RepID=UPI00261F2099
MSVWQNASRNVISRTSYSPEMIQKDYGSKFKAILKGILNAFFSENWTPRRTRYFWADDGARGL